MADEVSRRKKQSQGERAKDYGGGYRRRLAEGFSKVGRVLGGAIGGCMEHGIVGNFILECGSRQEEAHSMAPWRKVLGTYTHRTALQQVSTGERKGSAVPSVLFCLDRFHMRLIATVRFQFCDAFFLFFPFNV